MCKWNQYLNAYVPLSLEQSPTALSACGKCCVEHIADNLQAEVTTQGLNGKHKPLL